MHVVQKEAPFLEARDRPIRVGARHADSRSLQSVQEPFLVPLGLEPPDQPGPRIGQSLVVEVHGVLRHDEHADAEGARLLQEREQGALGRRLRDGREVPEDFVEVEQRLQLGRARLRPRPGPEALQESGHEEHPRPVVQVREVEDVAAGTPRGVAQQARRVEGLAGPPGIEVGSREDVVEGQRELPPLRPRDHRVEVHRADPGERRVLRQGHEARQIDGLAFPPARLENAGEKDVSRVRDGIGLDAGQREQARDDAADLVPDGLLVLLEREPFGQFERAEHVDRLSRPRPGGEDAVTRPLAQAPQRFERDVPLSESVAPQTGLEGSFLRDASSRAARGFRIDPGGEVLGPKIRKGEKQVRHVALGVEQEKRRLSQKQLLEQVHAESRLPAARHSDADPVGQQVARRIERGACRCSCGRGRGRARGKSIVGVRASRGPTRAAGSAARAAGVGDYPAAFSAASSRRW